jgi:predicted nucleic acid-binding Zn ribbon protein
MESLQQVLPVVVQMLIRDMPLSPGKVTFAWRAAVGAAIDRATTVRLLEGGVLDVRVSDQHWRRELRRSTPLILARLSTLLGDGTVTSIQARAPLQEIPQK